MNNLVVIIENHIFINPAEIYVKGVCGATGRAEGRIVVVGTSGHEAFHDYQSPRAAYDEFKRISEVITRGAPCVIVDLGGKGAIV